MHPVFYQSSRVVLAVWKCCYMECNSISKREVKPCKNSPGKSAKLLGRQKRTLNWNKFTRPTNLSSSKSRKTLHDFLITTFRWTTISPFPHMIDHVQRIYDRQDNAFRLNLEYGPILRHTETDEYRYFRIMVPVVTKNVSLYSIVFDRLLVEWSSIVIIFPILFLTPFGMHIQPHHSKFRPFFS